MEKKREQVNSIYGEAFKKKKPQKGFTTSMYSKFNKSRQGSQGSKRKDMSVMSRTLGKTNKKQG